MSTAPGSLVRVTKPGHRYLDQLVTIEEFVTAEESDDGQAFYWGSAGGGVNNVHDLSDGDFALAYTTQEAAARKPPTADQLAKALRLTGDHDVFDCDETEADGDSLLCYGTTPDGLRIAVELTITVREVDF